LVAAIGPLRDEELAEIVAAEFNAVPNLMEGRRPENPEQAVLSPRSTLISSRIWVQSLFVFFSNFSLFSERILDLWSPRTSDVANICRYHISVDAAHITLTRACLAVLLKLGEVVDKKHLATVPLAFYATRHWIDHAKFGDVKTSQGQNTMECLFDPSESYFAS
jgi:hypothetical protein